MMRLVVPSVAAVAALMLTGCEGTHTRTVTQTRTITRTQTDTQTATTSRQDLPRGQHLPPYVRRDPADFPKMASHLAFNFDDGRTLAHFALNVVRGCNPAAADKSIQLNPKQVNFIVPGTTVSPPLSPQCGAEDKFAITYGGGYWAATSPIVSPYRGVGKIRAFKDDDVARYNDGTRAFSDQSWVLNMFSSGNDNATAEWAARLKANWTLADLNGTRNKHPGIQGVWGDNFLWFNGETWQKSPNGSSFGDLDGRAWDNGLVRNFEKLRLLLGPSMLLGGNGAPWACSGEVAYAGDIPNGDCTAADAGMWEDAGADIYSATGWDIRIEQFSKWIKAGARFGHAKYGIMVEFGTCGAGNLGHPLTATDERVGLAMATIGGIHLLAIHDCDWGTTVVPGGQFSIPAMGDNAAFRRGWLGQPRSDPMRIGLGKWKRSFSGGIVYANLTKQPWNIEGVTVPADDALFVKA
jgi:hypothetical protein